jgi:hypothetical protein
MGENLKIQNSKFKEDVDSRKRAHLASHGNEWEKP